MRPFYEPRLLPRLLAGEKFAPLPPLAGLNRIQPRVKILDVKADGADTVAVTVSVGRGEGDIGANTDVYDLRLFRDGQLVASRPMPTGLLPDVPTHGERTLTIAAVRLPHKSSEKMLKFSAYAFNADRIKSETTDFDYQSPPLKPAPRRAFVVTMGVDASESPYWSLRFAANDAQRLGEQMVPALRSTRQFDEIITIPLVAPLDALTPSVATKANLRTTFDLLCGRTVSPEALSRLPNGSQLRSATPDDTIIIAFSGHGYADSAGQFFMFPSDVGRDAGPTISPKLLQHCISSDELREWMSSLDAGEIVLLVDACHSAAAIASGDFKPGPMGSRGLGQLAYDKGMCLLAAAQANDVALESDKLRQGLLSYALTTEGLQARRADDAPADGHIWLKEWMNYGSDRVPSLYEDLQAGRIRGVQLELGPSTTRPNARTVVQQPALFDFRPQRADFLIAQFP